MQGHVVWDADAERAKRTLYEVWPNTGAKGDLSPELALPRHFEQVARGADAGRARREGACGPGPGAVRRAVPADVEAGFDHVYFHQVGPDQDGFFRFWEQELRPRLERLPAAA